MMLALLIGGMSISIVTGIGMAKWLEYSGAVNQSHPSTAPVLDIVAGAVSLLIAWRVRSGRIRGGYVKRIKEKRRSERTGKTRLRGARATATALLEILLFNVIMFTLIEVPLVGYLFNPAGATAMVTNLRDSARRDSRI